MRRARLLIEAEKQQRLLNEQALIQEKSRSGALQERVILLEAQVKSAQNEAAAYKEQARLSDEMLKATTKRLEDTEQKLKVQKTRTKQAGVAGFVGGVVLAVGAGRR